MARALIAIVLLLVAAVFTASQSLPTLVLLGGLTAVGFGLVWRLTESHVGIARRSPDRLDHP